MITVSRPSAGALSSRSFHGLLFVAVGATLGTATFTAIGVSMGIPAVNHLGATGFSAAFTAAAVVAVVTAALGVTIARNP